MLVYRTRKSELYCTCHGQNLRDVSEFLVLRCTLSQVFLLTCMPFFLCLCTCFGPCGGAACSSACSRIPGDVGTACCKEGTVCSCASSQTARRQDEYQVFCR